MPLRRRLLAILVGGVLAWWIAIEILNRVIAHKFGSPFLPLQARLEDGTPARLHSPAGIDESISLALFPVGCMAIPLVPIVMVAAIVIGAEARGRRRTLWFVAADALGLVIARMWMLQAVEAAQYVFD